MSLLFKRSHYFVPNAPMFVKHVPKNDWTLDALNFRVKFGFKNLADKFRFRISEAGRKFVKGRFINTVERMYPIYCGAFAAGDLDLLEQVVTRDYLPKLKKELEFRHLNYEFKIENLQTKIISCAIYRLKKMNPKQQPLDALQILVKLKSDQEISSQDQRIEHKFKVEEFLVFERQTNCEEGNWLIKGKAIPVSSFKQAEELTLEADRLDNEEYQSELERLQENEK